MPLSTALSHPGCHLQSPGELNQQPHLGGNLHKTYDNPLHKDHCNCFVFFTIIAIAVQVNTAIDKIFIKIIELPGYMRLILTPFYPANFLDLDDETVLCWTIRELEAFLLFKC